MAVSSEAVARFKALFAGSTTEYGQYTTNNKGEKLKVYTKKGLAPDTAWQRHLQGRSPGMGQVPIDRVNNDCAFGAIDVDDTDVDHAALEAQVVGAGLPLVVCRSKSGGGHLYVFFKQREPAPAVRAMLQQWVAQLGVKSQTKTGKPLDVETFPKQEYLRDGDKGNWINLPYFGGDETNRYAVIGGQRADFATFLTYAERRRVQLADVQGLPGRVDVTGDSAFPEGPPCLEAIHAEGDGVIGEGIRNVTLYNIAQYKRMAYPDDWQERVRDYAAQHVEDMDPEEVEGTISSVEKRHKNYNCTTEPLAGHCDKETCVTRRFGVHADVKDDGSIKEGFPSINRLVRVDTDPPRWFLNVKDKTLELTGSEPLSYGDICKTAFEQANLVLPHMKETAWRRLLKALVEDLKIIKPPPDAGVDGLFRQHMLDFVLRRQHSTRVEDILGHNPYEEDGYVYFRSVDLQTFLQTRKFTAYKPDKLWVVLDQKYKAEGVRRVISGASINLWRVPVPKGEEITEEIPIKDQGEPEF